MRFNPVRLVSSDEAQSNNSLNPTGVRVPLIVNLSHDAVDARRVRYCVESQAVFAHSGSNSLPLFNTP